MISGFRTLLGRQRQSLILPEEDLEIQLEKLCSIPNREIGARRISENNVQRIRIILKDFDTKHGRDKQELQWHLRPRTYAILRNIGCLNYMDLFIQHQLNDFHLPYNEQTLPGFIERFENNDLRHAFLYIQSYFLSNFKEIELESSKYQHFHFPDSGDVHFASRGMLGQGGFGAVDLVVSRLSFKWYARKRVLRGRDSESNRRDQTMIIEELKQLKALTHRHLVKIVGSYTDKEYIAYLMSPVARGTLEQFLAIPDQLHSGQLEALRRFYGCLAGAVHHLHKNHIRHRDLTARNILIYDSGVYLSDFGSAYNWAHHPTSNTRHMHAPVSPDYMAPEVARKEQVGSSSDMWSLGIVFLQMTTRLLGRRINELGERISSHARKTKSAPYIYANHPVVTSWLEVLRLGNKVSEHDNEPLIWIQDLLRMIPKDRPSSRILMKDILESPSFTVFCCFKCHGDFQDGGFAYDSTLPSHELQQNTQDMLNTISAMFQDDTSARSLNTLSAGRRDSIQQWLGNATESSSIHDPKQNQYTYTTDEQDTYSEVTSGEHLFYDSYGYDSFWGDQSEYPQPPSDEKDVPILPIDESLETSTATTWRQDPNSTNWTLGNNQEIPQSNNEKDLRDSGLGFLEYESGSSNQNDEDRLFNEISEYSGSSFDDDETHSHYTTAKVSPEILPADGIPNKSEDISGDLNNLIKLHLFDETSDYSEPEDERDSTKVSGPEDYNDKGEECMPTSNTLQLGVRGNSDERQIEPVRLSTIPEDSETIVGSTSENEFDTNTALENGPTLPLIDNKEHAELAAPEQEKRSIVVCEHKFQTTYQETPSDPISESRDAQVPDGTALTSETGSATQNNQREPDTDSTPAPPAIIIEDISENCSPSRPVPINEQVRDDTSNRKTHSLPKRSAPRGISAGEEPSRTDAASTNPKPRKPTNSKSKKPKGALELSAANLRALGSGKQSQASPRTARKRSAVEAIDPGLFLKNAWESASTAPTSVLSAGVAAKLSGFLLPSSSIEQAHGLLKHYCSEGKSKAVRVLLQQGCNPGTVRFPRPVIIRVAIQGRSERHIKCVRALIEHGADVNVKRRDGKTPLHLAIENENFKGYVKLIWLLVNSGANVNAKDPNGDSPLTMLFHGSDTLPLEKHRLEALAVLLKADARVNFQLAGTGNTPLHLAVRRQDKWAAAMLLHKGAHVHVKNFSGMTPIQVTTNQFRGELSQDHAQVLDLLLRNISAKRKDIINEPAGESKRTPLHWAIVMGTAQAVDMLLKYGASPEIKDGVGDNAIAFAIRNAQKLVSGNSSHIDDHVEIMTLLNQATSSNWPMDKGKCVVEFACMEPDQKLPLLRKLISQGLYPDQKFQGCPLLHLTIKHRNNPATRLLVKKKAPVDDKDMAGYTAVAAAISAKKMDVAREMVRDGEFRDQKNKAKAEKKLADLEKNETPAS
ncbi:hypothetical protein F4805DRAFT_421190 [Annulohypoxylon moriforme]|nr:hypothetical protein F4805DRAFT_421190 [Annulohypoxylon moriforme]